jgi:two-component system CheB/CheR fusion protein
MPENVTMSIQDRRLMLESRDLLLPVNHAIDLFFTSLSQQKGIDTIAIIFSGMGKDGTKGVEAIAARGGLIIVQDPLTAQYPAMPTHVIEAGYADLILSPKQMPQQIQAYVEGFNFNF